MQNPSLNNDTYQVRFVEGMPIPEMAESCHPVRIIFVVLGPSLSDGSYHELGLFSFSTFTLSISFLHRPFAGDVAIEPS